MKQTMASQDSFFSLPFERELVLFEQKKFKPIYVVYGDEQFFINRVIESLLAHSGSGKQSLNIDILQGNAVTLDKILSCAKQMPMASFSFDGESEERRVVIVKNFELGRKKDNEEKLFSYLNIPSKTTVLLLEMPKLDIKTELYKKLSRVATMIPCMSLNEEQAVVWVANEYSKRGKKVSRDVCLRTVTSIGASLNDLNNALEKITTYVDKQELVTVDDVKNVIGVSRIYDFDDLWEAIQSKNISRSLEVAYRILELGDESVGLVARLSVYFMNQLKWTKGSWGKPSTFSHEEIYHALNALRFADTQLKSTSLDRSVILSTMIRNIVSKHSI